MLVRRGLTLYVDSKTLNRQAYPTKKQNETTFLSEFLSTFLPPEATPRPGHCPKIQGRCSRGVAGNTQAMGDGDPGVGGFSQSLGAWSSIH
jgi:hypothetical protein